MPIITVLIFRGTGGVFNVEHPYYGEPALVRAGHVGMSGIIDGKIIGFHPTLEATKKLGGEKALLQTLKDRVPQAGRLQDDTEYFERAYQLIKATNGRTTVYMYEVDISEEILTQIRTWYNEGREALYNFPNDDGQFKVGESNCAIFWMRFSIPLPVVSGNIREIIQIMSEEGFDKWSND
ncbi:MAG: hypothetical protein AAFV93_22310 [Chloroflexota bacterium]